MKEPVIICVDDEEIVLKSLKRELNEALADEYLIETVESGNDALDLFAELILAGHEVPLLISDHIMPDMKGDTLLKRIHARAPKTLKIMLTGQANMEAVTNAVNYANLYRYIAKPWEQADLVLTVKEALRSYFQTQQIEKQNAILQNMNAVLEEQVAGRTAELEVQKFELEQKNRQLDELNASKDKFFSIIAHDLRSPFTTLLGSTDLLLENFETYTPAEFKEDLSYLQAAAKKLYALLENLLAWSRIQRGAMPCVPETLDLYDLVQENLRLFLPKAEQKQIALALRLSPETLIYADYSMISTVLRNLIANALKFTRPGGSVTFSAKQVGRTVVVAVADTGVGIAPDVLPQLFRIDVHYTKPGTAGEEGTGLGLILCKELVEKNAGQIWVESKAGAGTTFAFTLPRPAPA